MQMGVGFLVHLFLILNATNASKDKIFLRKNVPGLTCKQKFAIIDKSTTCVLISMSNQDTQQHTYIFTNKLHKFGRYKLKRKLVQNPSLYHNRLTWTISLSSHNHKLVYNIYKGILFSLIRKIPTFIIIEI